MKSFSMRLVLIITTIGALWLGYGASISNAVHIPHLTPTPTTEIYQYPAAPPHEIILPTVVNLMEVDEDCLLPCFWEFRPGENTTQETTSFVIDTFQQEPGIWISDEHPDQSNFDPSQRGLDYHWTFLPLSSEGGSLQISFGSIDDIVVRIDIDLFMAANWLDDNPFILSELLDTYGTPTHVYMRYPPTPYYLYVLTIVYEEQGFVVEYSFGGNTPADDRVLESGRMLICVEDPSYDLIEITIQSDGSPRPLLESLLPSLDDPTAFRPFWDIEAMTGLTISEFTEAFSGNPEACIEAYSLAELVEQGY